MDKRQIGHKRNELKLMQNESSSMKIDAFRLANFFGGSDLNSCHRQNAMVISII